ncbi:ribosomal protein S9/S16-domain-containing protein [Endogone sp. FLAS-F59071]|nr:ribosomal protein S9/S16-domain-containing protein [Endogone sp. FLAS-F59071]|eukprot:RUS18098.1 ribosomal protein S9/S16-domain-containing protein [Endogone sp. FLAS-F59071]
MTCLDYFVNVSKRLLKPPMAALPRSPSALLSLVRSIPSPFLRPPNPTRQISHVSLISPLAATRHARNPTHTIVRTVSTSNTFSPTTSRDLDALLTPREKPVSVSYFTGNWKYNDLLIRLDGLYRQHWIPPRNSLLRDPSDLSAASATTLPEQPLQTAYRWKLKAKMSESLGIPLSTSQWRKIISQLNTLASLRHPLPPDVEAELRQFLRSEELQQTIIKVRELDDMGRAYGLGRRKESSARCWLVEGEGKMLVNGKELDEYFARLIDREEVLWPFQVTETLGRFNAWCLVQGGGSTGQAQAIKLGVSKALLVHDSSMKPTLRKAGCITRDPRVVERKKPGQRKARAKYTWVKR